jgi:HTH-type transcriptional regulator / antitoxin HipB
VLPPAAVSVSRCGIPAPSRAARGHRAHPAPQNRTYPARLRTVLPAGRGSEALICAIMHICIRESSAMSSSDNNVHERADVTASGFAVALRARRRHLGLTQEDAADLAGVSVRFVHELEAGKGTVRLATLLRLLHALGLHLELHPGAGTEVDVDGRLQ